MPTVLMLIKVNSVSKAWDIYEYLKRFHNLIKTEGGDLAMDLQDKGIYSLSLSGDRYNLVCKRDKISHELNVIK